MSHEFVMVTPPGWVEIEHATDLIVAWGENGVFSSIEQAAWGEIDSMLEAANLLPAGKTTSEARIFKTGETGERLRLWVTYIDLPPN